MSPAVNTGSPTLTRQDPQLLRAGAQSPFTAHRNVDYDHVVKHSPLLLDATGTLRTRAADVASGKVVLL